MGKLGETVKHGLLDWTSDDHYLLIFDLLGVHVTAFQSWLDQNTWKQLFPTVCVDYSTRTDGCFKKFLILWELETDDIMSTPQCSQCSCYLRLHNTMGCWKTVKVGYVYTYLFHLLVISEPRSLAQLFNYCSKLILVNQCSNYIFCCWNLAAQKAHIIATRRITVVVLVTP